MTEIYQEQELKCSHQNKTSKTLCWGKKKKKINDAQLAYSFNLLIVHWMWLNDVISQDETIRRFQAGHILVCKQEGTGMEVRVCFDSSSVASIPRRGKARVTSRYVFRCGQQKLWLYYCGYFSFLWCFEIPGFVAVSLSSVVESTES